jgi:hypothetical protein
MATGLAAATANSLLDALGRATNYTAPTAAWVKLHVGDPGAAGTSNAATETTRKQFVSSAGASGGTLSNTTALTWTGVAGSEDYTHYSVWTASTAGTFLWSGTITANPVTAGDDFTIAVGDLDLPGDVDRGLARCGGGPHGREILLRGNAEAARAPPLRPLGEGARADAERQGKTPKDPRPNSQAPRPNSQEVAAHDVGLK